MDTGPRECAICHGPIPQHKQLTGSRICASPKCRQRFLPLAQRRPMVCAGCSQTLTTEQKAQGAICAKPACRVAFSMERVLGRHRCVMCNRLVRAAMPAYEGTCGDWQCMMLLRQERQQEKRRADTAAFHDHLDQVRRKFVAGLEGVDEDQESSLVTVPAMSRKLLPMDDDRREALRRHLAAVFAGEPEEQQPDKAGAPVSDRPDHRPAGHEEQPLLLRVCATCMGHCCTQGENKAYLRLTTMPAQVVSESRTAPDGVIQTYLSHVPDTSYDDSCIYHGENGCALPRELRSSVCNNHYCHALTIYRSAMTTCGPHPALVVATRGLRVERAAWVTEKSLLPIDIPDRGPDPDDAI
jgi:hypothetical protein